MIRRVVGLIAIGTYALIASCGGGSDGNGDPPAASQPPPVGAVSGEPVVLRFGTENRIYAVAGTAAFNVPVDLSSADVSVALVLTDSPNFVTAEGRGLRIDPSKLPLSASAYKLAISAIDSSGKELGRQAGTIQVLVVSDSAPVAQLSNGGSVELPEVGLRIEALPNSFASGSAQLKVERALDSAGNLSTRVFMSEANRSALSIVSLGTLTAKALRTRERSLSLRQSVSVDCGEATEPGNDLLKSTPSVAESCIRGWMQLTVEVSCPSLSGVANSTPAVRLRTEVGVLPPWDLSCGPGGQVATIREGDVWGKLSGPKDWSTRDWTRSASQPILLVHGFTPFGLGGGTDTWSSKLRGLLESSSVGGSRIDVFEFQWDTNTPFEDAASELAEATDRIKAITGQRSIIVAHSFGGILARVAAQGLSTKGGRTLDQSVKTIVTVGTPHSGVSPGGTSTLPKGSDFVGNLTFFCWQITCHQAGASHLSAGSYASKIFDYADGGEIIERIADLGRNPLSIPIIVFIGLHSADTISPYSGDALITFAGQRFSTSEDLSTNKRLTPLLRTPAISEYVLGALDATDLATAVAFLPPRVIHSPALSALAIGEDYSEPYIESSTHPSWSAVSRYLALGALEPAGAVPSVDNVDPTSMAADGVLHKLTIVGSGFQSGNVVQFKWGSGSGAGVWTTSSRLSLLTSSSIVIDVNTGTVDDTIHVRVCRSASREGLHNPGSSLLARA